MLSREWIFSSSSRKNVNRQGLTVYPTLFKNKICCCFSSISGVFFFFFAERSCHCLCYTYIWWTGGMGNAFGLHPRWWAEEVRETVRHCWTEKCQQLAFGCWDMASIGIKALQKGTHKIYQCPIKQALSFWFLPFQVITSYGILPLISTYIYLMYPKASRKIYLLSPFVPLPYIE